jgi:hypothetical protein
MVFHLFGAFVLASFYYTLASIITPLSFFDGGSRGTIIRHQITETVKIRVIYLPTAVKKPGKLP